MFIIISNVIVTVIIIVIVVVAMNNRIINHTPDSLGQNVEIRRLNPSRLLLLTDGIQREARIFLTRGLSPRELLLRKTGPKIDSHRAVQHYIIIIVNTHSLP